MVEDIFFSMKNTKFRNKILMYNLPLVVLPILIISIITGVYSSKYIIKNAQYHTEEMLGQIEINMDAYIESNDHIISSLALNEYVLEYLNIEETEDEKRVIAETKVRELMGQYKEIYNDVSGILIVPEEGTYLSNEMYRITREPLRNDDWYEMAVEHAPNVVLISKPIGRNVRHWQDIYAEDIVSVAKSIYDPVTNELLGVINIDMKIEIFEEALEKLILGQKGFVFVMDSKGDIVYTPTNDIVYRIKSGWINDDVKDSSYLINGKEYSILQTYSEYTHWSTIGVFEDGVLLSDVKDLILIILLIAGIMLALGILTSTVLASSISQPLKELQQLMQKAESGDMTVRFNGGKSEELIKLGLNFNNMIFKIQELLHLVYKEQRSKRKAELNILQQQIKPHFLYNTLDTIQWMAQEEGMKDIVKMVNALSKMFRISISRGKEFITLAEEIDHLESYLTIQKMRYEDKLSYYIDKDVALENCIVVKLILQPIVENAIYHGIKQKLMNGHIWIEVHKEDDVIAMYVKDDGVGLTEDQVKNLNEALQNKDAKSSDYGYGIFNVNDRIRLFFGDAYMLRFVYSEVGATVKVTHPIIEDETMLKSLVELPYKAMADNGENDNHV